MTRTGNVAVFTQTNDDLAIRDYPVGAPPAGQALLRLARSGVCGTDLHIHEGRLAIPGPFIPGHEFIGTIDSLGENTQTDALGNTLAPGDIVIACAALACGTCMNCQKGETASCLNFGVTFVQDPEQAPHFFGGFADYLYSPASNLVKIPSSVALDAAAAFPCAGPTMLRANAYGGGIESGEIVVVQGTGPVGLFAIAFAHSLGATVYAIGSSTQPKRMELAQSFGAHRVFDYRACTPEERREEILAQASRQNRGDGADVVIEASGAPSAFIEGLNLLRTRGRYFVPGQYSDSGTVEIPPHLITLRALRIIGSGQYTLNDVAEYLSFLESNQDLQDAFAKTITHRYPVREANAALAAAKRGESIKAVFSA